MVLVPDQAQEMADAVAEGESSGVAVPAGVALAAVQEAEMAWVPDQGQEMVDVEAEGESSGVAVPASVAL